MFCQPAVQEFLMLDLIKIREDLHKIPELAFHEFKTKQYIEKILENYKPIKVQTVADTGLLVEYSQGEQDYLLFRADMDGLPITERTKCSFASTHSGNMHACGHDIHMTILLGLIDFAVEQSLQKNILFLFQPAEEGKGGAKKILESGILESYSIKECYALHVSGQYPLGTVATKPGVFFANTQEIDVSIQGKSAHVAFPEEGIDTIKAMRLFLDEVDTILQKFEEHNKQVLCYFGKMDSGVVRNAISENSYLEGTVRALQEKVFHEFLKELFIRKEKISAKTKAKIEILLTNFYQAVKNNEKLVEKLKISCKELGYDFSLSKAEMTGEDFGYFSQLYPSLLFWLGASDGKKENLHSSRFLPSAKAIEVGLRVLEQFLRE
jgi:N-acetyldiaminopimelate deacetylase